ncbi:glycosyltransferase family 4 protein [uncultured Sphingomonas sp.]|uniref:glycosyltransferase family 4 protein n=1 Tax=uncultured Sphingomonas sp. TaxID=158754 RepID=UPI0035CBEC1B
MRIGIDGYNLAMPAGTGVATYGLTLARTLAAGGHATCGVFGLDVGDEPAAREVAFFDQVGRGEPTDKTQQLQRRERRALQRRALNPWAAAAAVDVPLTGRVEVAAFADRLPRFDRVVSSPRLYDLAHRHFGLHGRFVTVSMADPPDVMHWTYPVPVTLAGARNIYTLHDLVPMRLPYTTLDAKALYARLVARCAARGSHVCTVSEASRRDITELLGIKPDKVTNCHQASPTPAAVLAETDEASAEAVRGVFGLAPQGYFLFFGAIEPKKNIGRLIEAYLGLGTDTPLVIVGARAWQSEGELHLLSQAETLRERSGRGHVVRLDYLPRALLLKLVRSARAVAFPSLYEGFGLPVLEAMQLGTPVLTSDTSSMPEIAGDAAVIVDPYDVGSIADGLRMLDGDAALRDRLARAGPARAERFSQAKYLARLEAMYRRVVDGSAEAA